MKYLKKFNESVEDQIYNQVLDTIRDCFLEFEDNGWYWISKAIYPDSEGSGISVWNSPNFNCRMLQKQDVYVPAKDRKEYIDWTGRITSDGKVIWETKDLTDNEIKDITEGPILEEAENFLTAVKRIQSETGLDFNFSYNNRGGEKRIIIQGRI